MKFTSTDKAPAALGPYSQAVSVNGLLFTSGQIALDPQQVKSDSLKFLYAMPQLHLHCENQRLLNSPYALDRLLKWHIHFIKSVRPNS